VLDDPHGVLQQFGYLVRFHDRSSGASAGVAVGAACLSC
jgi:hypothetical protein